MEQRREGEGVPPRVRGGEGGSGGGGDGEQGRGRGGAGQRGGRRTLGGGRQGSALLFHGWRSRKPLGWHHLQREEPQVFSVTSPGD